MRVDSTQKCSLSHLSPHSPVLILAEHPPLNPDRAAAGLTVRHTRMAQRWVEQGYPVSYAWIDANTPAEGVTERAGLELLPLATPASLNDWAAAHPDAIYILGYWEFEHYLPSQFSGRLILDYVAPRLLERQFEDASRLAADVQRLIPLLRRCDQVWVGNERQCDLLVPLMLLAGHSLESSMPIKVVPISAPVQPSRVSLQPDQPLKLFHGGRDWPWRNSQRWIAACTEQQDVELELIDASQPDRWSGFDQYLAQYDEVDVALELADENIERRYSQSFRATDALCRGVPIICNRFLPLAEWIESYGAGWVIDEPAELPELLTHLNQHRDWLAKASTAALKLAHERLDQQKNYAPLAASLHSLAEQAPVLKSQPLMSLAEVEPSRSVFSVIRGVFKQSMQRMVHGRVERVVRNRPKPSIKKSSWVVVSRPDIFPTNHGAAVKIERTAWALSFHVDQVILLTEIRHHYWEYRNGVRTKRSFPLWMRVPGWPSRINLLRLMAKGLPYSNAFLYIPLVDRGIHLRLMWLIGQYPVEVVQGDFPAYAHPAVWASNMFGTRSLLVEHNVEFLRIAEQVPELSPAAAKWLKEKEVTLANACQRVITVSERDRDLLIHAGVRPDNIRTIPHGVDLDTFTQATPVDVHQRYGIERGHAILVYHGIYSYPPNLMAVQELSKVLLPQLEKKGVHATVLALGPEPPSMPLPGVVFTGSVDDLAGHLKAGDLAVIPLRDGGGTRMKILDDFAAGVAVVSTAKGMEGIPVEHGKHLWIENDPEKMAKAVIELLQDEAQRQALIDHAHEWVSQFDWKEIAASYVDFVRSP